MLELPTAEVTTQNVTKDPPPVTVSIRFPIAPAPVSVALAAVPVICPLLVAPDTADVAAQLLATERPQLPTQDVRLLNYIFRNIEVPNFIPRN